MKTEVFHNAIGTTPEILHRGGLVAVPTETVYGLACNGLDEKAVEKIYEVKGRPEVKPLALMVSGAEEIDRYCKDVPSFGRKFAERHWPGPVTVIFRCRDNVPSIVTAGGDSVALRCPDQELTLSLLREAALPLAAPSANPSGEAPPCSAEEVLGYFDGIIDAVIDGGTCQLGVPSMIVDFSTDKIRVLRPGPLKLPIYGLTGTSGSGKTTALHVIRDKLNAGVIDCDALYHEMLETDAELNADLQTAFPDCYENGKLDRKALASMAFSDPEKLRQLNTLTHSHIICEVLSLLLRFQEEGKPAAAIDAVELISSGLSELCRKTIAVVADENSRIERIMKRDGISTQKATERIRAQKGAEYYRAHCSSVVENNGSLEQFKKNVEEALI